VPHRMHGIDGWWSMGRGWATGSKDKEPAIMHAAGRERERYAKRSCVDLKRGVMGRAPWCKNYTVPLPCVLHVGLVGFRPPAPVLAGSSPGIPWCFLALLSSLGSIYIIYGEILWRAFTGHHLE
jgi:hypothetical protein